MAFITWMTGCGTGVEKKAAVFEAWYLELSRNVSVDDDDDDVYLESIPNSRVVRADLGSIVVVGRCSWLFWESYGLTKRRR